MSNQVSPIQKETDDAIKRVAHFEIAKLARNDEFGAAMSFEEVVPHAKRLADLFKRITFETLVDLPDGQLEKLKNVALGTYKLFDDILQFSVNVENPTAQRRALIDQVANQYQTVFNNLAPWIAYSVAQTVDFTSLADEGRSVVQDLRDRAEQISEELKTVKSDAEGILEEVRRVAAEQGVTQQAKYFSDEANKHKSLGDTAANNTFLWAICVGLYGVISLFIHKWAWLTPTNTAESIQLFGSKLVLFFALTYMLVLSARNMMAHRHNEVVNRHKQNALMTFNALVDAGGTTESQNTILNHAAASIYQPQDSGYSKRNSESANPTGMNALLGMILRPGHSEHS